MTRRQKRPGAGVYDCSVEKKRKQTLHSVCSSLMTLWTSANRGCLAKNYWSIFRRLVMCLKFLHILKTYPPSPTQMDGPCVQWQCCWGTFTSVCRTLFHNIAKIRKHLAAFLVELPRFRTAFTSRSSASRLVFFSIWPLFASRHYLAS